LDARAAEPVELRVALESADGTKVYGEQTVAIKNRDWERVEFHLTASGGDTRGRLTITLSKPGSVELGYVSLQPGDWGRFKGLPVRADVAQGLIDEGVTVLRYGGSMVNADEYRWKKMIGPRDQRPPYHGTWYPYSSDGWGIVDFLNFCDAAGILGIPDLNVNESPQDMADFIEYVNGPADSTWGSKRAADGHPAPYGLKQIELGNEERVDDAYFAKFKGLAEAIWAKDANMTLVVGDFCYHDAITDPFHITGADSKITTLAAQQQILRLAKAHGREVWFDVHIWTEGPDTRFSEAINYYDAMQRIADGANFKVAVFELNANNHELRRGLANARSIFAAVADGRFPVVTSANGLQPDGQNDNGWDQGLLFLNPSQAWSQPPGYVTQMISRSYEPFALQCRTEGLDGKLDVCATGNGDGKSVALSVVNVSDNAEVAKIEVTGFAGTGATAEVVELSARPNGSNAAGTPGQIVPVRDSREYHLLEGGARFEFRPHSLTVIMFH
jgi:alpha-L-arabinofuranosidase